MAWLIQPRHLEVSPPAFNTVVRVGLHIRRLLVTVLSWSSRSSSRSSNSRNNSSSSLPRLLRQKPH